MPETWVKTSNPKAEIRVKFDIFVSSLNLVFPSGSSLKSEMQSYFWSAWVLVSGLWGKIPTVQGQMKPDSNPLN